MRKDLIIFISMIMGSVAIIAALTAILSALLSIPIWTAFCVVMGALIAWMVYAIMTAPEMNDQ